MSTTEAALPKLLVVEPDFMLRSIIVGVVREMGLAQPQEALSVERAEHALAEGHFDAVLIALNEDGATVKLLERLRGGHFVCPAETLVAVTAQHCDSGMALRLRELDVRRLLLKPFKVKGVIETIGGLFTAPAATA